MTQPSTLFALKPPKFALALTVAMLAAFGTASAQTTNNWHDTFGQVWKNGTGQYCWRDAMWTPSTGVQGCDGVPVPHVRTSVPPPTPTPAPVPAEEPPPPKPTLDKVEFRAKTLFDFDQATVKETGRPALNSLISKAQQLDLETIIVTGYTDSTGNPQYNQRLSERRADAVKAYLVQHGVDADRIHTEGKGDKDPIASNIIKADRAQNRRVEIEVIGTSK